MTLPERLKHCRTLKRVSQKEAAEACSLSLRAYQYYEYGEQDPSAKVLIALADYFDVSIDYLVGRSDIPERR